MSSHAKLSTSSRVLPFHLLITFAIITTLLAMIASCRTEKTSDIAPPLDSVLPNYSTMTLDSGVILVTTPDTTNSIHPAGPLVALSDSTKPQAVPIPNAYHDSSAIVDLRSLDSMLVRELEKTKKR